MYKLYYYPLNASMAPRFVLEALGVDHELVLVDRKSDSHKSPEYLALNPTGRIPAFVTGKTVILESAAICIYLCEKHPEAGLMPVKNIELRARFFQWLLYLSSTLQAELMIYFYPERHSEVSSGAEQIRRAQDARISQMLSILDAELEGHEFLLGTELSVCDYFLFMLCIWADGISVPPLSFKNLNRHLRLMVTRPEIIRVCQHENLDLSPYA
ncbi:MAG: glutathione S-transferase family protein [Pseudohongiella sp.]|uniref:glutathione S-transferase family protein n=1 Tax=Pseudohongiella sp. TaxID=1979412 RepID=UPI00349FDE10